MNFAIQLGDVISVSTVGIIVALVLRNNHYIDKKIDTNKKELEDNFVDKDVCKILHKGIADDIKDIKKKTDCVPQIKAGMDLLLQKNGLKNE